MRSASRRLPLCVPLVFLLLFSCIEQVFAQQPKHEKISFDIAAQPLADALVVYARVTGIEILVDDDLLAGRYASPVSGMFHPTIALRRMVAAGGLDVRYVDRGAVTLLPHQAPGRQVGDSPDPYASFSAALQSALGRVMGSYDDDSRGPYRVAAQMWIGPTGSVQHAVLLDTTGDGDRDAAVAKRLESLEVGQKRPDGLPQPATVIVVSRPSHNASGCRPVRAGQLP